MALGTFSPGPYTMTWNAIDVGLVNEGGKLLSYQFFGQDMRADKYGMTAIDQVYQGGRCFLGPIFFKEWITNTKKIFWPYPLASPDLGALGVPGVLESDQARAIILTPVTGTPAASIGGTITASKAVIAKGNDLKILFGCEERDVPVLFELLPYDDSGTVRFFKVT